MGDELERRVDDVESPDIDGLLDLGCDLFDEGKLTDGERCCLRATDLGSATAAFDLGNCLARLGRRSEAVGHYEVALAGGVVETWLNLGLVLADLGDRAGATHAYEQAEAAADPAGPLALAFQLCENGDMEAALAAARCAGALLS